MCFHLFYYLVKITAKLSNLNAITIIYLNDIFTCPSNLAGNCALSIPCGFSAGGLPIGLQLIGKRWDEERLLRAAGAYQQKTDWHGIVPEIKI